MSSCSRCSVEIAVDMTTGAPLVEGGQEGALTDEFRRHAPVQRLVVHADDGRSRRADVPPSCLTLWVDSRRGVERPGCGSAPVHQQWLTVLDVVAETDTAHVSHGAIKAVEAAEDQPFPCSLQLFVLLAEHALPGLFQRVQGLRRELDLQVLGQPVAPGRGQVEKRLFLGDGGSACGALRGGGRRFAARCYSAGIRQCRCSGQNSGAFANPRMGVPLGPG